MSILTPPPLPWHKYYTPEMLAFDPNHRKYRLLSDVVRRTRKQHQERTAYSCILPGNFKASLSFRDLDEMSSAFAVYLREELGLERGKVVAVVCPNTLSYPIAFFGLQKAGLVYAALNPLHDAQTLQAQLKHCNAQAVIASEVFADKVDAAIQKTHISHVIWSELTDFFPMYKRMIVRSGLKKAGVISNKSKDGIPFGKAVDMGRGFANKKIVDDITYTIGLLNTDTAVLQYTSGTKDPLKAVELTHQSLIANAEMLLLASHSVLEEARETVLAALPLSQIYGLTSMLVSMTMIATHQVLLPFPMHEKSIQHAFRHYNISILPGMTSFFRWLSKAHWFLDHPPKTLRLVVSSSIALSSIHAQRFEHLTGCSIMEGYGLTEASPTVCVQMPHVPTPRGSCGVPLPGLDVKIIQEDGRAVKPGEIGELLVRGPTIMKGYYNRPDDTRQALRGGWLHTNDMAHMDKNGCVKIYDSKADIFKVNGLTVFPSVTEGLINAQEGVKRSAVVPRRGSDGTCQAVAFVVKDKPHITEDDLISLCGLTLEPHQVPTDVFFVDALPKSNLGKIERHILRDQLQNEGLKRA